MIDQLVETEKNGDIYILFTSDVHCGIDSGFGYAGLWQIRNTLESQGYETILVDDGDAIQGETIGTLSKGEKIIELMNAVGYDVAIPGNHEFDYGMDNFLKLAEEADFPYISCNFNYMGEPVFDPYGAGDILEMNRGGLFIHPEKLDCDLYHFFSGEDNAIKRYRGEYMNAYSWADIMVAYLDRTSQKIQ